jgi:hypothetical protein
MGTMGVEGADDRTVNEAFGFLMRLAILSGSHLTDYVIDVGTCWMIGGPRTQQLIAMCVRAGLMEPTTTAKGIQAVRIIQDDEFIHLKLKKEVEWDRQRLRDIRDTALTARVRLRDGDQCRYCGQVVEWRGRTTHRKATYDHVHPGQAATVDTLVVACLRCNTSRQDDPSWCDDHPLLPPPSRPLYAKWTVKFLEDAGYTVEENIRVDKATKASTTASAGSAPLQDPGTSDQGASAGPSEADPGSGTGDGRGASAGIPEEVDPGSADHAASAGPSSGGPGAAPSPDSKVEPNVDPNVIQSSIESHSAGSGRDGPGRDGTGGVGKGRDGSGRDGPGRDRPGGVGSSNESTGPGPRKRRKHR